MKTPSPVLWTHTSFSLKHPVSSVQDTVGRTRIGVMANDPETPRVVMGYLKTAFSESNASHLPSIIDRVVREAEARAQPLSCYILGKA